MVDDVFADAQVGRFHRSAHLGLPRHRQPGRVQLGAGQGRTASTSSTGTATRPPTTTAPTGCRRSTTCSVGRAQHGIKLIIPLTNNWNDFGGMDQYVRWAGGAYHDEFYTNPTIRGWYKDWISHVLDRVNPLTGVAYKDDPHRHGVGAGQRAALPVGRAPTRARRTAPRDTLTDWADEMSAGTSSRWTATTSSAWATKASSATTRRTRTGPATAARGSTRSRSPGCRRST